jgi:hypothetical protein
VDHPERGVVDDRHRPLLGGVHVLGLGEHHQRQHRVHIGRRDDRHTDHLEPVGLGEVPDPQAVHTRGAADVVPTPACVTLVRAPGVLHPVDLAAARVRVDDRPNRTVEFVADDDVWQTVAADVREVGADGHPEAVDGQPAWPALPVLVPVDLAEAQAVAEQVGHAVAVDVRRLEPVAVTQLVGDDLGGEAGWCQHDHPLVRWYSTASHTQSVSARYWCHG